MDGLRAVSVFPPTFINQNRTLLYIVKFLFLEFEKF